jgi:hypothetical protein
VTIWCILWPLGKYILWPFGIFFGYLIYFMAIWYILWPFGIFCGHLVYFWLFGIFYGHLVYFRLFTYVVYFSRFGLLYQEKSGNPGPMCFA